MFSVAAKCSENVLLQGELFSSLSTWNEFLLAVLFMRILLNSSISFALAKFQQGFTRHRGLSVVAVVITILLV